MPSFLSLPTYASDGDTLVHFSMQVGSIVYVFVIVYLFATNANVRMMLLVVYLSLTTAAYLFTLNSIFELTILLTVFICSFIPLLSIYVLAILDRIWGKA